jgi:hypothetical protein
MLDLAANNAGKPITLDFISQRQNISLSYLEQLFAKLRVLAGLRLGLKNRQVGEKWVYDDYSYFMQRSLFTFYF